MAIGSFMGQTFTVSQASQTRIFAPNNIKGSAGSEWAIHETVGKKGKSQWLGPKLRRYTMDIMLRAQDGVNPRNTLDYFQRIAESDRVDYFVIGGRPLSNLPFKLSQVSDSWDTVIRKGKLIECKVSLTIEEYQ